MFIPIAKYFSLIFLGNAVYKFFQFSILALLNDFLLPKIHCRKPTDLTNCLQTHPLYHYQHRDQEE